MVFTVQDGVRYNLHTEVIYIPRVMVLWNKP